MTSVDDARQQTSIEVTSPDGTVRIAATISGAVSVLVRDVEGHTDESFGRQVQAATRVALASLQQAERRHRADALAEQHHEPSLQRW